jgi:hypothetical protein
MYHSRYFGIRGGHGKSAFKLAVKLSVELGYKLRHCLVHCCQFYYSLFFPGRRVRAHLQNPATKCDFPIGYFIFLLTL